jgi:hypothetical protein
LTPSYDSGRESNGENQTAWISLTTHFLVTGAAEQGVREAHLGAVGRFRGEDTKRNLSSSAKSLIYVERGSGVGEQWNRK